jgi:hypothetical protein
MPGEALRGTCSVGQTLLSGTGSYAGWWDM